MRQDSYQLREGNAIQFRARHSRPAYCYWLAFRPDGEEELCFPEDPHQPPLLTDWPAYPTNDPEHRVYMLTDGAGIQVFAIVVSDEPLSASSKWCEQRGQSPWRATHDVTTSYVRVDSDIWIAGRPLVGQVGERCLVDGSKLNPAR